MNEEKQNTAVTVSNIAEKPQDMEETINSIKKDLEEIEGHTTPENNEKKHYASFMLRLFGYIIDQFIINAFTIGALVLSLLILGREFFDDTFGSVFLFFAPLNIIIEMFYFVYFHAVTGRTFGKLLCGTKVIDQKERVPGFKKAVLRYLGYIVCRLTLYIGFLWILFDSNSQGWHDKIAKTYVSKEK